MLQGYVVQIRNKMVSLSLFRSSVPSTSSTLTKPHPYPLF